jgi:hypothetical protein
MKGFALVEALIAVGVLSVTIFAATKLLSDQVHFASHAQLKGEVSDLREFLRQRISCEETVAASQATCKAGGYVEARNAKKEVVVTAFPALQTIGGTYDVRVRCQSSDGYGKLDVEFSRRKDQGKGFYTDPFDKKVYSWASLYDGIPLTCQLPGQGWYQASKNCTAFCSGMGLSNVLSPDLFTCASGEDRPPSGAAILKYTHGTWGGGVEFVNTASYGKECYGSNPGKTQKQDHDATDQIVGCYCE